MPHCGGAALTRTESQLQLQTPLYMMTVSVEVPHSRHDGFQIPRTARCFWRACISMVV